MPKNGSTTAAADWRRSVPGISNLLHHALETGQMADVEFSVGREYGDVVIFPAHKFILSLNSDVFNAMFNGGLPETRGKSIDITEVLPDAFSIMLVYMYTGSVEDSLRVENVFHVIYCADKYNLPLLMDLCLQFVLIQLEPDTCLAYLEIIKPYPHDSVPAFMEKCLEIADALTETVLRSEQFLLISQNTLEMVVQRETLSADENSIYTAVEKWAVEACRRNNLRPSGNNRRQMLGSVLFLVRFPLLTDAQLVNGPAKSELLSESELLALYKYKHAIVKPPLAFPTEPRTGCGWTLQCHERVFVQPEDANWLAGEVSGIEDDGVTVQLVGRSVTINERDQIVRASDILKKGQAILAFDGVWKTAKYYSIAAERDSHVVRIGDQKVAVGFVYIRISRDEMAARKAAHVG
ncbi:BTB/POZ domain-containing protein 6-B-like [Paramacrobiotus metropolitanus]|uniref:BTB/POZ domain-containing protein 6-B-like n=1 Tax=Paramacrobiotus metropolitanus TaxID=2943436 RepID=UPI002445F893|nr:BTB/POZ domain-containing protein 6-B-like [Paramacrobiotus metropolitanus]